MALQKYKSNAYLLFDELAYICRRLHSNANVTYRKYIIKLFVYWNPLENSEDLDEMQHFFYNWAGIAYLSHVHYTDSAK